jgi:hypothetical protein
MAGYTPAVPTRRASSETAKQVRDPCVLESRTGRLTVLTGERIVSTGKTAFGYDDKPSLIKPFSERKIAMIACGQQHSLALSDDGYVWAWGKRSDHSG